jgi:hypothetical protein
MQGASIDDNACPSAQITTGERSPPAADDLLPRLLAKAVVGHCRRHPTAEHRNHQAGMPRCTANASAPPSSASPPMISQADIERRGLDVDGTIVSGQYSAALERPIPIRLFAPGLGKIRLSCRCRCFITAILPVQYSTSGSSATKLTRHEKNLAQSLLLFQRTAGTKRDAG